MTAAKSVTRSARLTEKSLLGKKTGEVECKLNCTSTSALDAMPGI